MEKRLVNYAKNRCLGTRSDENLFIIDTTMSKVAMRFQIPDTENGVRLLHGNYIIELKSLERGNCTRLELHIAINILRKESSLSV